MASWYTRSSRFICIALKNTQRFKIPLPSLDGTNHPKFLLRIGVLGFLGCAYYWNLERVPYTNRSHFVIASTCFENLVNRNVIKHYYEGKVLSPLDHPLSIRVQRIGKEIVEAAMRKEEIPEFEWEFVVVDLPIHCPDCLNGGKIVVGNCYGPIC